MVPHILRGVADAFARSRRSRSEFRLYCPPVRGCWLPRRLEASRKKISLAALRDTETAWSLSGQLTGLTDLALTEHGEQQASLLGERLSKLQFSEVLTSPVRRANRTCELAGFGAAARVDADLVEWDYGKYEGLRRAETLKGRPAWKLFCDGCPGGRITRASRCESRPERRTNPGGERQRADLLQRAFPQSFGGPLAGPEQVHGRDFVLTTASVTVPGAPR